MVKGKNGKGEREERIWETLFSLLKQRAASSPGKAIYVRDRRGAQEFRTLSQVYANALRVAEALRSRGVKKGEYVLIALPTGFDFLSTFFGLQALGAIPVPLGWPRAIDPFRGLSNLVRWRKIAIRYDARFLICDSLGVRSSSGFSGIWPPHPLKEVVDVAGLLRDVPTRVEPAVEVCSPSEVAYIQPTSGSTGSPRGVKLTHQGIFASVEAIGQHIEVREEDVLISWLPLDNIMGLVGAVIFALHWNLRCVLMHPDHFLENPEDWLWAIHDHRASLSLAPNFGDSYCVRRANTSALTGLDLSSWRIGMNGSEPVRAQHIQAFARRFHEFGLKNHVIMPVYGLSEATLGVTFHRPGEPIRIDGINRKALEEEGMATPLPPQGASRPCERMHLVSLGRSLAGVDLKIIDQRGENLGERRLGEIAIKGQNLMAGYVESTLRGEGAQAELQDGWLHTGDLGYLADGELFYLCRQADLITLADGRKIFPEEVELFVDAVDGIRAGSTALFSPAPSEGEGPQGGEKAGTKPEKRDPQLVLVYELQAGADPEEIEAAITLRLQKHLDFLPGVMLALPVRSVPKTGTGKVRRQRARRLYEEGLLGKKGLGLLHPTRLQKGVQNVGEVLKGGTQSIAARLWGEDGEK